MRLLSPALLVALLFAAHGADASGRNGAMITHSEPLKGMVVSGRAEAPAGNAAPRSPMSIGFDALGRHFDLDLEANTSLLSPEALAALGDDMAVLRGSVADTPGSWARIVMADGQPSGMLYDGQELLAIEPGEEGDQEPRIFRLADLLVEPGAMSCGVDDQPATGQQLFETIVDELRPPTARAAGAVEEIEIGALADSSFAEGQSDAVQAILTRINNVDGIYSSELGIQITVPTAPIVFDDSNDPFTSTTDPDNLLDELASFRANNSAQQQLGLTHLFTGRELNGSTVGIAFIGVLCNAQFGVGLSEGTSTVTIDSLIAAHEIGHNFGASHDGEVGGSCPLEPTSQFIMATRVNGNPEFSDCSKAVMLEDAAEAACILPLPATDMRITSFGQPETVFLGNTLSLTFAADNRGSSPVSDVIVDIVLPPNVNLLSGASSQGSCLSGAGLLRCSLGTVAGSSGATIVLSTNTVDAGDVEFIATVAATGDDFAGNNEDRHAVSIVPAVNLAVLAPALATVNIDESTTANVTVRNTATIDATGVTLTAGIGSGLNAIGASWTGGDCTVTTQDVVCTAATLSAGAETTLELQLLGTSAGNRAYGVELTANEADADETNNSVQGNVTVSDPNNIGNIGDDEGGGSVGTLLLLLASGLMARRRRGGSLAY